MSAVLKLKPNSFFEDIPENQWATIYQQACVQSVVMAGRAADESPVFFRPNDIHHANEPFTGEMKGFFRATFKNDLPIETTFSFVLGDVKYLFRGLLQKKDHRIGVLKLITGFYQIQRRALKRLKIPEDYYAVVRITHVKGKLVRAYGKLMDISPQGMGFLVPKNDQKIQVGDSILITLNLNRRPPELLEMRVLHFRRAKAKDGTLPDSSKAFFFGGLFLPEHSIAIAKKMNALVMDLYKDIFGKLTS